MYYNFYTPFVEGEKITSIPHIEYPIKDTDKTYIWDSSIDRLDKVSQAFYNNPYGAKLILIANASLGSNEDEILNGAILVIPYPYKDGIQRWIDIVNKYKKYY
jgi:hypothetical protein